MNFSKLIKSFLKTSGIITLIIFLFPLGLFIMWKRTAWPKKTKWIVSALVAPLMTIGFVGAFYSPPTVTVANVNSGRINTDQTEYTLSGSVSSIKNASLSINNELVPIAHDSKFTYKLLLAEGDNTYTIESSNPNGAKSEVITIHRTTKAELSARTEAESLTNASNTNEDSKKAAEANVKAQEVAARTKAAEEKAKKAKATQEAQANAKSEEEKSRQTKAAADEKAKQQKLAQKQVSSGSKTTKHTWFHWSFGKSDQAKAEEQAKKAKAAQEKLAAVVNAKKALIGNVAPIYCAKHQNKLVKLTSEGGANGWPSNNGEGWTNEDCTTIISKLYDSGATEEELGLVADGKYAIGMHEMSLLYSVGSPEDINTTRYSNYKMSQYVYGDPLYNATYIYVENGLVTSVQN